MIGSQLVTRIHRPTATRRPGQRGQSLVEFALVLPVFMLLVFGILDGGRAILTYNDVSQSTRNVARVASVSCFDTATRCSTASGTPIGNAMAGQIGTSGPITWTVTCIDPDTAPPHSTARLATSSASARTPASRWSPRLIAQALGGTVAVNATSEATVIQ